MDGKGNLCIQDIPVSKSISVITYGEELFKKNLYVPCSSVRSSLVSYHDFLFMCQLINYRDIDPQVSKAAAKKFSNHFWYLVPETVALALFDDNVPPAVKANMAQVFLDKDEEAEEEKNQVKRYILPEKDFSSFPNIKFPSLLTPGTKTFFNRFSLSTDFLNQKPFSMEG